MFLRSCVTQALNRGDVPARPSLHAFGGIPRENKNLIFFVFKMSFKQTASLFQRIYNETGRYTFQRTFSKVNGKEMNTALTAASGDQWKRIR